MSPDKRCRECGASIPEDAPLACCPRCLVALASGAGGQPAPPGERQQFGHFELLGRIGEGASSVVYRGRDLRLNRTVALKLIRAGHLAGADELQRFRIEAEAAANLDHPGIVPVLEVGEHDGWPFLAMKLIEGRSLAEAIAEFQFPTVAPASGRSALSRTELANRQSKIVSLLQKIARAVQHAHDRGILHRDLKPSNILLDAQSEPFLTDFGIAKWTAHGDGPTRSYMVLGTPRYMSPEQAAGRVREITVASDVYSLGAILFELLAGRSPFEADSDLEMLRRVAEQEPPALRSLNPQADHDLETICSISLQKEPARRYASAAALAEDLDRWLRHEPIEARRISPWRKASKWVRRNPVVAGLTALLGAALLGGFAGGGWLLQSLTARRALSGNLHLALASDALAHDQTDRGIVTLAQLLRRDPQNTAAASALLAALGQRNLPLPIAGPLEHEIEFNQLAFSPDQRFLAAACGDKVAKVWRLPEAPGRGGAAGELNQAPTAPALTSLTNLPLVLLHSKGVNAVAFSPDGGMLASASDDHTARLWALPSGQLIASLAHTNPVRQVKFSPDGRLLATLGGDPVTRAFDTRTGELRREFVGHHSNVTHLAFSPDGTQLLTTAEDARLWDLPTGQPALPPLRTGTNVCLAAFTRMGDRFLTASADGRLHQWDARTGALLTNVIVVASNTCFRAEYSPDGQRIATAARDVRVWDAQSGQPLIPPVPHGNGAEFARFSPDGSKLLTLRAWNEVHLWNAATGEPWGQTFRSVIYFFDAVWSPDGNWIATAGGNGVAMVWDVRAGDSPPLILPHKKPVRWATFSPRGDRVLSVSDDGTARVWDAFTGLPVTPRLAHTGAVSVARFSPDGLVVFTASDDGTARRWNAESGQEILPPFFHGEALRELVLDPQGRHVATSTALGNVRVWSTQSGAQLAEYRWPGGTNTIGPPLRQLTFTPDGKTLVLSCADGWVRTWDFASPKPPRELLQLLGPIWNCRVSTDGERVAVGCFGFAAVMADLRKGRQLIPVLYHDSEVSQVALSPDGRILATAATDGTARLWDAFTGSPLALPLRHTNAVTGIEFSPDGRRVVTASRDGTARVWDVATGLPLCDPLRHPKTVFHAEFSADGQRVVTSCSDGAARVWEVPASTGLAPAWLSALAEAVVGQRLNTDGAIEPVLPAEFARLRAEIQANTGQDAWSRWGRWFVSDRSTRTIAPNFPVTIEEYVRRLETDGDPIRLREAALLSPPPGNVSAGPR